MFGALVFDLDGTLWDASEASVLGWNEATAALGITRRITIADLRGVTGKPAEECIRFLFPSESEMFPNLPDVICEYETKSIREYGGRCYENLSETLKRLALHFNLYLVSNCQEWYMDAFFRFSGVKGYFKDTDCHGRSNQSKVEMLIAMKDKHDIKNPVYIGDTEGDEKAARQAGYAFIFAAYGFGKARNPDVTIRSLGELESI